MSIEEQAQAVRWDGPEDRVQAITAFGHAVRREALEEAALEVLRHSSAPCIAVAIRALIDKDTRTVCSALPQPVVAAMDAVDLEERNGE